MTAAQETGVGLALNLLFALQVPSENGTCALAPRITRGPLLMGLINLGSSHECSCVHEEGMAMGSTGALQSFLIMAGSWASGHRDRQITNELAA